MAARASSTSSLGTLSRTTSGPFGVAETTWELGEDDTGTLAAGETKGELQGQNKSIIWGLLKQLRPGMDASRVILPTFCLEPRSFLDKTSDVFYHADLLTAAAHEPDAERRFLHVVRWFVTFFYKKPKGLQKPYNPLLGEFFRCHFELPPYAPAHIPATRAFLVSEQVSHHPPVTATVCSNRRAGWVFQGAVVCGSKFYGNSALSSLDAHYRVHLLPTGEVYEIGLPDMNIRGIVIGSIMTEFAGKCSVACAATGFAAEFDFKSKPVFGGAANHLEAVVRHGGTERGRIKGKWDETLTYTPTAGSGGAPEVLFANTSELHARRLVRRVVPLAHQIPYTEAPQGHFESEVTWRETSEGIRHNDQDRASRRKAYLEDMQRVKAKKLAEHKEPFLFRHFAGNGKDWTYKDANLRAWDPAVDLYEFELDGRIHTLTRDEAADGGQALAEASAAVLHSQDMGEAVLTDDDAAEDDADEHEVFNDAAAEPAPVSADV